MLRIVYILYQGAILKYQSRQIVKVSELIL
jgi:hypothetical protein